MPSSIIGALRVTLGLDSAQFEKGTKQATASLNRFEKSVGGIRTGLGTLTKSLATLGVALSVGTVIGATKRALEYAASLGETAQQLGVTTEALQVFRFAGSQVGIKTEEMDILLRKLSDSIAEAGQGSKQQAESFNELGVNVKLANGELKNTDGVLREMAEGFKNMKNEQDLVRVGTDLMGKSGAKAASLLAGGAEGIDEFTKAAHELTTVLSDEQIQNADRTADKLDQLSTSLSTRIAGQVADNASSIEELANALADLAEQAVSAAGAWLQFMKSQGGGSTIAGGFKTGADLLSGRLGQSIGQFVLDKIRNTEVGVGGGFGTSVSGELGTVQPFRPPSATGLNRITGGGGRKKGGGGKSAEQLAEEAARKRAEQLNRAFDLERDLVDAKAEELRAQQDLLDDYVERADIDDQLIDIETDQTNKQLDLNITLAKIDGTYDEQLQTTTDQLKSSNERLRILKKQEVRQQVELDRQRDFEATQATVFGIQRDLLGAQSALAETADERRRVELQILDLAYRERRERLERIVKESKNSEDILRAQLELASLPAQRALDTQGVVQGTRGPLESFQAGLPTTAEKLNEALQNVAVNGLQALEDGIISVIDGTKSLVEAFHDMASQIISELLRIQIERAIIAPVSDFLSKVLGVAQVAVRSPGLASDSAGLVNAFPDLFATGGFTGFGPTNRIAGLVHKGEFVMPASAVRRIGISNLEAMSEGDRINGDQNFNINVAAPNTGDPRRDRQTALQQAVLIRHQVAMSARKGA